MRCATKRLAARPQAPRSKKKRVSTRLFEECIYYLSRIIPSNPSLPFFNTHPPTNRHSIFALPNRAPFHSFQGRDFPNPLEPDAFSPLR